MFDSSLYFSKKRIIFSLSYEWHIKILATALVVSTYFYFSHWKCFPFISSLKYARMQHQVFVIVKVILEAYSQNLAVLADSWKILLNMRPSDRVFLKILLVNFLSTC